MSALDAATSMTTYSDPRTTPTKGVETYIFASIAFFSFIFGLTGSIFSLLYFLSKYKKKKSSSTLLFIFINITDGTICLLSLFIGVSEIAGPGALFSYAVFCDAWGVVWYVAARMSIFLIAFLSLSRTYMIIQPLAVIELRKVVVPTLVYLLLMILQQTFVFWFGARYQFDSGHGHCSVDPLEIFRGQSEEKITLLTKISFFIIVPLENIFPWVFIVVSCILTVRSMKKSGVLQDKVEQEVSYRKASRYFRCTRGSLQASDSVMTSPRLPRLSAENKRTATVNILILTMVYLVFNTFSISIFSLDMVELFSNDKITFFNNISERTLSIILHLAWVHSISLNSACNVIVYFCRLKSLRSYTIGILTRYTPPSTLKKDTYLTNISQNNLLLHNSSYITIL